jgi:hypothetical protein
MTPYYLFKFSQRAAGKGYNGTKGMFDSGQYYAYFAKVARYLNEYLGDDDSKQKEFVAVCAKHFGNGFSPFSLDSESYKSAYEQWLKVHGSVFSYKENILSSCRYVYNFCRENEIYNLPDYVQKWGVTHLISGRLNENLAVFLGLHEINMSRPEKAILKKKFFKNLEIIKERIEREVLIKEFIQSKVAKIRQKLTLLENRDKLINENGLQP